MAQDPPNSPENWETQLAALRGAVVDGEASGPAEPFDFDAFIAAKKR